MSVRDHQYGVWRNVYALEVLSRFMSVAISNMWVHGHFDALEVFLGFTSVQLIVCARMDTLMLRIFKINFTNSYFFLFKLIVSSLLDL